MSARDPNRLIAALVRDRIQVNLKSIDLCFLAALYLRANRGALASFEEDVLIDQFEQVCDVVEPAADNPRKRATHAIQRLRDQRMLCRIDGAGIMRGGEYALTRLAAAIIEYFIADEALTRESLTLLLGALRAQLAEVLAAARKAVSEQGWRQAVIGPLRVTVSDLVSGIERRQRGLDAQQEEVQAEIAEFLAADWFSAIAHCQSLLEATTLTLRELNEILLRDTHHLIALLQDIQTLAIGAEHREAEEVVQRVIEHVDRIAAWGGSRQRVWSDYYQYVHRYLRDVVRLDPDRALSQRLRDQLSGWVSRPFCLLVAQAPSISLLRPLQARVERPAVTRPRVDREPPPTRVDAQDEIRHISDLVQDALAAGARTLAQVTARVLPLLPEESRYRASGRIAGSVARRAVVSVEHERPWVPVDAAITIEDWTLSIRGEVP